MTLNLGLILADAGIDSSDAIVLRHAFKVEPGGIHADSSDAEINSLYRRAVGCVSALPCQTAVTLAGVHPRRRCRSTPVACRGESR